MPFNIALSGLNAASTELEVTGNNIANSATNGFKQSRAEFADVFASSVADLGTTTTASGVRVADIAQQFSQGAIDFTSNSLDLAISGGGFFVVADEDGSRAFTRAGAYSADRDGFVINSTGQRLQIYEANTDATGTTNFNTGILNDLQLPTDASSPEPTTSVIAGLNLNSTLEQPVDAFDINNAGSYNSSTSTTVYDSLGNPHTATYYFRKTATPNQWDAYLYVDEQPIDVDAGTGDPLPFTLAFDDSGALDQAATGVNGDGTVDFTYDPANGAAPLVFSTNFNETTQFGSSFAVNNLTQDGYASGRLSGVSIDDEGVVFARYTNGRSAALGKVALAKFNNTQGLQQIGDNNWAETFASGQAQFGEAGTSNFGVIQSGALEGSNVDIAEQLVKLISAQRNYQANAQVISTADAIAQTIINIR